MISKSQNIFSFESIKALVLTFSMVLPIYLGIRFDAFQLGFAFALGTLFTFLPNTDGSNKHRFWGILSSLFICLLIIAFSHVFRLGPDWLFYVYFALAAFSISMFSVYGFRGSMVTFSGQLALVMSFALLKTDLSIYQQLTFIALGGLCYLALAWISHRVFEHKNATLKLAECIETTADFLKIKYQLLWNDTENQTELENSILKLQVILNDQHELLRELLYLKRKTEGQSNKTNRLYLIFLEILDIYELSLAIGTESQQLKDTFANHTTKTAPLRNLSAQSIVHLYALATALRNDEDLPILEDDRALEDACEKQIAAYVQEVKLPMAREGALLLRTLLDYEAKQWQKVGLAKRVYANILNGTEVSLKPKDTNLFITAQDYGFKTLKRNLSMQSSVFRHALRYAVAMLVGLLVGSYFEHQNAYWILLSLSVILRPNFGLTKQRAVHRIIGTLLGATFAVGVIYLTNNPMFYGLIAIVASFTGFSFLHKDYRVAATSITVSILLLYAILIDNALPIIAYRVVDTLIGSAIAFSAIYLLWPSWEEKDIKNAINKALKSASRYLKQVNQIYHSKEKPDTAYRLSRKKAFIATGNLMAAFQRLTEDPKSHQEQVAQIYAMVVLNQTFLNATAAFGTYIQNHETTTPSKEYQTIISHTFANLKNTREILLTGKIKTKHNDTESERASEVLEERFHTLENIRDAELTEGFKTISTDMRNKLQEGKLVSDQLNWLHGLSDSMKQTAEGLV